MYHNGSYLIVIWKYKITVLKFDMHKSSYYKIIVPSFTRHPPVIALFFYTPPSSNHPPLLHATLQ